MTRQHASRINTLDAPKRIWELDFIRGICILLMVMDHLFYNFGFVFDTAWKATGYETLIKLVSFAENYWDAPFRVHGRLIVVTLIFMICGISNTFSRSNLKRGLQLMAVAMIFTLVTEILANNIPSFEGMQIRFGVLHMLASCILIWWLISVIFRDKYAIAAACFTLALAILLVNADIGTLCKDLDINNNLLAFISFETAASVYEFSPGDFFPLIPNLGLFMAGAALGPLLYGKRRSLLPLLDRGGWYKPFNFVGRHTLEILVLHQPVIMLSLALISYLFITPGNFVIA